MIVDQRIVAVIPARGGSKSIPHKNIRPLGGKPLIAWSIEVARNTPSIDRILVSTDHPTIAAVAREHGAEIYDRPEELASDHALVVDAIRDLINTLRQEGEQASIMVLLEPTCPFRAPEDVQDCLETMIHKRLDSVATFKEADLNPHRAWVIEGGRPEPFIPNAIPWLPRQQQPSAYQLNGAVYAFRMDGLVVDSPALLFGKAGSVIMPPERSIDIDNAMDLLVAEAMLATQ